MCPVVYVAESRVVDDPSLTTLLDDEERTRAERKREPVPYISAHAMMRRVIGRHVGADPAGLSFARRCTTCGSGRHGKPSIADHPGWTYSLSYTREVAVLALARDVEVGVDIEHVEESDFGGFPRVTLAEGEIGGFFGLDGAELLGARAQVWARKEAILKATGHGLVVDPTEIVVSSPTQPAAMVAWHAREAPPEAIRLADIPLHDDAHRAAVAALTDEAVDVERVDP